MYAQYNFGPCATALVHAAQRGEVAWEQIAVAFIAATDDYSAGEVAQRELQHDVHDLHETALAHTQQNFGPCASAIVNLAVRGTVAWEQIAVAFIAATDDNNVHDVASWHELLAV